MMDLTSRRAKLAVALVAALTLGASVAEARAGRGGSFGSRGARTYQAPPATRTAPDAAAPIQRSQVPNQGPAMQRPTGPTAGVAQAPRFGTGFMGGLLGAGLLGMLFGAGFFGGLSGLGSMLGFLIQVALVLFLVSLAIRWFRRRENPAYAGAGPARTAASGLGGVRPGASALGGLGLGGGARADAPRRSASPEEVSIGEGDYAAFERSLNEIQSAYSRQDVAGLWSRATPEMAGYLQEELNENARNGVINRIDNVRLVQGDLSESWREGATEYATVAMRYEMTDVTVEKTSGRVVEGSADKIIQARELWTFRRDNGGEWKLSAIQQA
jgi:predicted lipid-binding transport protein (Tim44 family)